MVVEIAPDPSETLKHISLLLDCDISVAGDQPMAWAAFPDFKEGAAAARGAKRAFGTYNELREDLIAWNRDGLGIFFTINEAVGGFKREHIIALRAQFAEDDTGTKTAEDYPLQPTFVVQSEAGQHAIWRLVPGEDLAQFTPIQKVIAKHYNTDPSVNDAPRVLRAAGFVHAKKPDAPFLVFIEEGGNGQSYTQQEIREGLGLDKPVKAKKAPKPSNTSTALTVVPREARETSPEAAAFLKAAETTVATKKGVFAGIAAKRRAPWSSRIKMMEAYLRPPYPAAISGQGGDTQTIRAAMLARDFALDEDGAMDAMATWNERAQPSWEDEDLRAKIRSALRSGSGEVGSKCAPCLISVRVPDGEITGERVEAEIGSAEDLLPAELPVPKIQDGAPGSPRLLSGLAETQQGKIYRQLKDPRTCELLTGMAGVIRLNRRGNRIHVGDVPTEQDVVFPIVQRNLVQIRENVFVDEDGEVKPNAKSWSKEDICTQLASLAKENSFDPVIDYLESLPTWDGVDRSGDLLDALNVAEPKPIFKEFLRKTMLSAVARAYEPGCKVDTMLILHDDKGGTKKSTFFRALVGRNEFFSDYKIDVDNKDSWDKINQFWLIEWSEMRALQTASSDSVKSFLSRQTDDFRSPYARETATRPRMSIFVGSTNPRTILENEGGLRRFWIIPDVGSIDLKKVDALRDSLWSQAVASYRAYRAKIDAKTEVTAADGWWLSEADEVIHEDLQLNHVREYQSAEIVAKYVATVAEVTMTELLHEGGPAALQTNYFQSKRGEMEIGRVLTQLGWRKSRTTRHGAQVSLWTRGPNALPMVTRAEKAGIFSAMKRN